MTRLFNDPRDFATEMIEGFAAANASHVRAVQGGVVRRSELAPGKVAVVIGGGSGHYPAFGGLVGSGLAAGAAMGNLFASPSAQQVYEVASRAHNGGGVLLSYGNYAGDVLNFEAAQERLRREGIDCRTVLVTDDVASAPREQRHRRRGIAGDLVVFKVAGAAAEAGETLDEVERPARRANDRTRSFGVAFSGCTLPGAGEPLFEVSAGRMALGLGIHGEPGLGETEVPSADGLARLLVEALLEELPDEVASTAGARAVPVLNGLGSVKYEELFVVYRTTARLLKQAGVRIIEPEVGEFCTSFDMAGVSLTLLWLDDELEPLWRAAADGAAYRKYVANVVDIEPDEIEQHADDAKEAFTSSPDSRRAAATIVAALGEAVATLDANVDELGRIDAVAGDGDHGIGMQRGARAALEAARDAAAAGAGARAVLTRAGDAWAYRAGGTSGALWGLALGELARSLDDMAKPDRLAVVEGVGAAVDAIMRVGRAQPGDKTMVDALRPFSTELRRHCAAGAPLAEAWTAAADTASTAAAATADLLPRIGRARPHAEKSLGTPDAGAHSFALIVSAITPVIMAPNKARLPGRD